jgi:isobutyryl-CoA mutase small subunit
MDNSKVLMAKLGSTASWPVTMKVGWTRHEGDVVVLFGTNVTPNEVVEATAREQVQAVGLSVPALEDLALVPEVMEGLKARKLGSIPVVVGSDMPDEKVALLKNMGVAEVFRPGIALQDIVIFMQQRVSESTGTKES